jgi:hypothetical protein
MGANPFRTQTINFINGIVISATPNTRASSLALQIDFMGMNQGSRLTPIYHSCKAAKKLNYRFFNKNMAGLCVKGIFEKQRVPLWMVSKSI